MINKVILGYNENWYPKKEPVIPRTYHEYMRLESKMNLYTMEELGANEAFFVSKPEECKVFTYGGARAALVDESDPKAVLLPGSKTENTVKKVIRIKPTRTAQDFVRVHIALSATSDDALPTFNASYNMLHFNAEKEVALAIGEWNWGKAIDRTADAFVGPSGWNYYGINVDGINYNVYVVTYETAVEAGSETASNAIHQVYLDAKANATDLETIFKNLGTNEWELKLAIETVPAKEYENAFVAFENEVAKKVGTYNVF